MKNFLNVNIVPVFHGNIISHLLKSMFIKAPNKFSVNLTVLNEGFYSFK